MSPQPTSNSGQSEVLDVVNQHDNVQSKGRSPFKFMLLLFVAAFVVRLVAVIAMRDVNMPPQHRTTGADGVEYNLFGLRLSRGEGYTWADGQATSRRAPGLPLLLAVIYAVVGENYPVVYVVFCLLGAAACVGTYGVARELLNDRQARWAGWLACFYVPHVYFATRVRFGESFRGMFSWRVNPGFSTFKDALAMVGFHGGSIVWLWRPDAFLRSHAAANDRLRFRDI